MPALPVGEALHPVTLAGVVLLVVNDWILKPRFHGAITGKLSDLAGLAFAPVVLSAAIGLALHLAARLGARLDPSLSQRRLALCIAATGVGFTLVELVPAVADLTARAIGRGAAFYSDWTDLLCLPCLAIAWWIGRDELRRVPLGRPAGIHRLGRSALLALADAGGDVTLLARAIDRWDVTAIDAWLARRG